jgi:hypothetical protein
MVSKVGTRKGTLAIGEPDDCTDAPESAGRSSRSTAVGIAVGSTRSAGEGTSLSSSLDDKTTDGCGVGAADGDPEDRKVVVCCAPLVGATRVLLDVGVPDGTNDGISEGIKLGTSELGTTDGISEGIKLGS